MYVNQIFHITSRKYHNIFSLLPYHYDKKLNNFKCKKKIFSRLKKLILNSLSQKIEKILFFFSQLISIETLKKNTYSLFHPTQLKKNSL